MSGSFARTAPLALALAFALAGPAVVAAVTDTSPPTGGIVGWDYGDEDLRTAVVDHSFADPESGIAGIDVTCSDGGSTVRHPFADPLVIRLGDPAETGCSGYGMRSLQLTAVNGVGLERAANGFWVSVYPAIEVVVSPAPTTGQPITLTPVIPDDVELSADVFCEWEFRWGSSAALDEISNHDETFGSLLTQGPASAGACDPWTFTLPSVPFPQFEYHFSMLDGAEPMMSTRRARFRATAGSTDRHIRSSTLPIAYILPSTYTPIVGEPVTYRLYTRGVTVRSVDAWNAYQAGSDPWVQAGGSTFTITPRRTGNILVCWNAGPGATRQVGACYDPPARYADTTRPNTTVPVSRVTPTVVAPGTVPVTIAWSGSDRGWGVARYQLQRSVDGGTWRGVSLPSARSTSISQVLSTAHTYRYRVRAVDKAGNVGDWDVAATFRPRIVQEANANITYRGAWTTESDGTALGGSVRVTGAANASASFAVSGRAVAWVAERGPGRGQARVYVDGSLVATVDLTASVDQPRRVVWRRAWTASGAHTIRIVALGTAGRPIVDVDAFLVLR